jgi:predicted GNAT superfamily acetyltransferase
MAEFETIELLQAEIWGTAIGITPGIFLFIIAKEGGVVLLALEGDKPVGFNYGIIGLTAEGRVKLASHQTGVLPAYQDRGLGFDLKLAQREAALGRKLNHITWTFDPLQGRNARLNLRKLGAVCADYIPDLYGDMPDTLNKGLPSDRFNVDWWIASEHVARRLVERSEPDLDPAAIPVLNKVEIVRDGLPYPPESFDQPAGQRCLVEVPADISSLKRQAPDMALAWRLHTRQIFQAVFGQGYTAVDLLHRAGYSYYLLEKDWKTSSIEEKIR